MSRDDDRVRLPVVLGPVSNGEFLPAAAGPGDVRLAEAVLQRAAAAAGRLGIDRRRFLQTAGGMAALLGTLNLAACSGEGSRSGGSYSTPPPEDLQGCEQPWRTTAPATLKLVMELVPADCTASNRLTCLDRSAYLHDMFLASDTTMALLSDLPATGA